MDQINMDAWVGRETLTQGCITPQQAAHIQATVSTGAAPVAGDVLPPLWHWCAFPAIADNDALGPDGHIRGSVVLPPIALPRRMWAGGALSFGQPLHVGEAIEQRTRIRSVTEKTSKAGPMVLVTLDHHIYGENGLAIEEQQNIVYLEIPDTFTPPEKRPIPVVHQGQMDTPQTVLFRYSAITFNAHRIHYDLPYTQNVEHYPNLVVHGPLQATWLMAAAIQHKGRPPVFFDFRGVHPMFSGPRCDIATREDEDGLSLWTGQNGHQCMQAKAVWKETQ
ncbi:MAG: MaoC family dehydratase N-terminal domain-containing protein [Pseudomonadota bacterium]